MTKLNWGTFGERYFEAGVDRGVLYLPNQPGAAWPGLTAVQESPTGGEAEPHYIDGFKYANLSTVEEFEATIEAYHAPPQFARCDGTLELAPGLSVAQQRRTPFNFSYRTRIGNDLDGLNFASKIHLIYNALAEPSERGYTTMNDSTEPLTLSWSISTTPVQIGPQVRPSSHFVIDSRNVHPVVMQIVEGYLYGTNGSNPTLPTPAEIIQLLNTFVSIEVQAEYDNSGFYVDEVWPVYVSPTPPPILAQGQSILWLDTSPGTYSILRIVTGE